MNISNLFVQILTPLLYFTSIQQSNTVNIQPARIGKNSWDFPPHSSFKLKESSMIPYNATLESGSAFGYEAGCKTFMDSDTSKAITPKFSFNYPNDTTPVKIQDCNPNIQPGRILTECSPLSFRHSHNVEIDIKNEQDVHVLGTDCDIGL